MGYPLDEYGVIRKQAGMGDPRDRPDPVQIAVDGKVMRLQRSA